MQLLGLISSIWLLLLAAFVALMVYRGHLTRRETGELFLDDTSDLLFRKAEHDLVLRRVDKIHPFCQGAGGATAALTIAMLGVAVAQALPYVHF